MPRSPISHNLVSTVLTLFVVALAPAVAAAFDVTLSIPETCPAPIAAQAFGADLSSDVPISAGGVSVPRPVLEPFTVLKRIDECSPLLYQRIFTGRSVGPVTVQVTRNTGVPLFTVVLNNAYVTKIEHEGAKATVSPDGGGAPVERLSIRAAGDVSFTSGATTVTCDPRTFVCQ